MSFGVILGWVIGTQQASMGGPSQPVQMAAPAESGEPQRTAPPLDDARARTLTARFEENPRDAGTAVELGDVYFAAEQWDDALTWYGRAQEIDPSNADASAGLGAGYLYTNRFDQAIAQLDRAIDLNPNHQRAMLNKGLALAFGREDLRGASEEWKRAVAVAADSPEGQTARRLLESLAAGHDAGSTPATESP